MFKNNFSLGFFLLANLVVYVDLLDLLLRIYFRHVQSRSPLGGRSIPTSVPLDVGDFTPYQTRLHLRPYALVVSVYNVAKELDTFLEAMRPHFSRLWVIDDASTDDTWERLQRAGVSCVRGDRNRNKPGAIKHLLDRLPAEIETVVVLDPDARILDQTGKDRADLEQVLFEFQRSGMAALCPRVGVRPDGWLSRIQAFEYWLSCSIGRRGLADRSITSGVAVYRRDALARVLNGHSLSIYAEDLKNALMLIGHGERIYYDGRLVIETEGKHGWHELFSQRVGWFFGFMKVYVEHFRDVLRCADRRPFFIYQYLIYMGVFGLLFHPLKLLSLAVLTASAVNGLDNLLGLGWVPDVSATNPLYFLWAYLKYTTFAVLALILGVETNERKRLLPAALVYFIYALMHLIPVTVGYLNWFSLRWWGRRLYTDHYQKEVSLGKPS